MKAALLCNGPSRIAYKGREGYTTVMGCNIPWTEVDSVVILDENIAKILANTPELIKYKTWFGRKTWMYIDEIKARDKFKEHFAGLWDPKYPYYSSGHAALEILIQQGYCKIDIYGCDSWFEYDLNSYTHKYSDTSSKDTEKCIDEWRKKWLDIIANNPNVKVNFISYDEDVLRSWA